MLWKLRYTNIILRYAIRYNGSLETWNHEKKRLKKNPMAKLASFGLSLCVCLYILKSQSVWHIVTDQRDRSSFIDNYSHANQIKMLLKTSPINSNKLLYYTQKPSFDRESLKQMFHLKIISIWLGSYNFCFFVLLSSFFYVTILISQFQYLVPNSIKRNYHTKLKKMPKSNQYWSKLEKQTKTHTHI